MIVFGVKVNAAKFNAALGRFPKELARNLKTGVATYLQAFRGRMGRERLRGRPGVAKRTGFLTASQKLIVTGDTVDRILGVYAIGGGVVKYAALQEYGGVVKPTRAKFLAIPLEAAKTAAGVSRYVSPRDLSDTFIRGGIIYQNQDGKAVPMFALRKSVRIPPRLGVRETWEADREKRLGYLKRAVAAAVEKTGLGK